MGIASIVKVRDRIYLLLVIYLRDTVSPKPIRRSTLQYLRLLDAALQVSECTEKIDTVGFGLSKAKRIVHQIREFCAILSGLVLAADYKEGQELFTGRDFASNADFYQKVFKLGRRHKIINPDKIAHNLRQVGLGAFPVRVATGGVFSNTLLQGNQKPEVRQHARMHVRQHRLGRCKSFSLKYDVLDLLRDPLITTAAQEIAADKRRRREIQRDIEAQGTRVRVAFFPVQYSREPRVSRESVCQAL